MPNTSVNAPSSRKKRKPVKTNTDVNNNSTTNNVEQVRTQIKENFDLQSPTFSDKNILNLDQDSLIQAMLWSEILGKPVSKRRGRW